MRLAEKISTYNAEIVSDMNDRLRGTTTKRACSICGKPIDLVFSRFGMCSKCTHEANQAVKGGKS